MTHREQVLADFEKPLELLAACHDRIEMQCEALRNLVGHLPVYGCDAQAQQAASNVMRYFDGAGRHHREDEELDLFPLLAAAAKGQNAERIALLVDQIRREYKGIEQTWLDLRDALESIAHGENAPLDGEKARRFCGTYRAHIAMEEAELFPLAEMLLKAGDLAALGKSMAARRGIR